MKKIAILITLPLLAALNDPGEGLATRNERRTARVTQWQAQYEVLTAEQIQNQARSALEDLYESSCLYQIARNKGATGTDNDVREFIEDRLSLLLSQTKLDLLDEHCAAPAYTPSCTESTEDSTDCYQGELINKILVIRGVGVSDGIRSMLPVLPRVNGVPPLVWGTMSEGTCIWNAARTTCFASAHPWHEVHLHMLEAIIRAEGREDNFALVDSLVEVNWEWPE